MEKVRIKVIQSCPRYKANISKDLREYVKKENELYEFVGIKENPLVTFSLEFKIWKKKCPKVLTSNQNIMTSCIVFDRFKIGICGESLRRLYFGTLSMKNTIPLPYIPGRAEKLVDEYNVKFSKKYIYKKNGIILLCPNRHTMGWYMHNKTTLTSLQEIERNVKLIKEHCNLPIEIRTHPKAHDWELNHICEKYNVSINKDTIELASKRAYAVIGDRSAIGVEFALMGNLVFNFQTDWEHTIVGKICIRDPILLDPYKLDLSKIPTEEDRYNYLQYIATYAFSNDEINNGYFLEYLHPIILQNKDKFQVIETQFR
tara:strand:+ start:34 stop:978 length:945 start_codon:yes stop_codon:yes gene_type:complete